MGNHVIVIQISKPGKANFVTAFVGGTKAISKIRSNPIWE